jgi:hypothetical protein
MPSSQATEAARRTSRIQDRKDIHVAQHSESFSFLKKQNQKQNKTSYVSFLSMVLF